MGSRASSPFGTLRFQWLLLFGLVGPVLGGARPGGCPPRDLWDCCFLGLGRLELPRGAWKWRGLAWGPHSGSGGGAAPAVCGQCSDPRFSVWRPQPFLALFSCLVPLSPSPTWHSPLLCSPPPSRPKVGPPRFSPDYSGSDSDLGESAESFGGWVRAEGVCMFKLF